MAVLIFCLGLAGLLTLEEAGLFLLPGDISLVAAGLHVAPDRSQFVLAWLAASIGMVVGSSILFHGVSKSRAFNRMLPPRVRRLVRRHGIWGVAAARLVPGLRNATVFAAASADMHYPRFMWGLIPAAVAWSGALLLLGWLGGAAMLTGFSTLHHSQALSLMSFSLLAVALGFVCWRLRSAVLSKISA
jgi:membrane protein DedA with SNARE-associated domain